MNPLHRLAGLALLALTTASCDSPLSPSDIAGRYILTSTSAASWDYVYALSGELHLHSNGAAFLQRTLGGNGREPSLDSMIGRYRVRDGVLELSLRAAGRDDAVPFRSVPYRPGEITIRSSHPADGPDIIEIYQKQ